MEGDLIRINEWLLPVAWLYGIGVRIRNEMFETGILKSRSYDIPVISVGNITVGGTGKTPHTEYLIRLLQQKYKVAVLSRGYKRKSKGFVLATADTPMQDIGDEPFLLTYGDGVSNVDLNALLEQHQRSGKVVTLTGIQPGGRFGVLDIAEDSDTVVGFREKAKEDGGWINGGFMAVQPELFDYLSSDESCVLERTPMEMLAQEGKLGIYKHYDFWQCMDTQRDKGQLEALWDKGNAPWKIWE